MIIALLVLANPVNRWLGLLGGLMAFTTPLVTLSFLITTPEHGYPHWVTLIMVSLIYPVLVAWY